MSTAARAERGRIVAAILNRADDMDADAARDPLAVTRAAKEANAAWLRGIAGEIREGSL